MLATLKKNKCSLGFLIILTMILAGVSCSSFLDSTSSPVATELPAPTTSPPEIAALPSSTVTLTSAEIKQICPEQYSTMNERILLDGKLLYWDYPSVYTLSFPDLEKSEIASARSSYISIAPSYNYFVTVNEGYDEQKASIIPYLDVIGFNGQVISSTPWKEEWGEGDLTWRNNEELLIRTMQEKTLVIYNPFSGIAYNQTFHFPDENRMQIVTFDPFFKVVAYMYSIYNDGFGSWNNLRIWNEENQTEILNLKDEFSSVISDIALSTDGKKIAITTATPNEDQNHSEIIIVDIESGTYTQISNFRSYFDEILIPDIQWSLDDETIYFWPIINDGETQYAGDLFNIELQTNEIRRYCFSGRVGFENKIIWASNAPGFYFTTNTISFSNSNNSSKDEWDILLVDSGNNTAYKVAENVSLIGWLTP